jgi:hypothetical protein
VIVPDKPFQPNVMFVGKGPVPPQVNHLSGTPLMGRLQALIANIRQGCKGCQRQTLYIYCKHSKLRP